MIWLFVVQAQQEIPDWLEAVAAGSYGTGGFTNNASQFRDTRRGNVGIFICLLCYTDVSSSFMASTTKSAWCQT